MSCKHVGSSGFLKGILAFGGFRAKASGKHAAAAAAPSNALAISTMMIAKVAIVLLISLVIVGCAGIGFASAGISFMSDSDVAASSAQVSFSSQDGSSGSSSEAFILETAAQRDMSVGVKEIADEEAELARIAEERERTGEAASIKTAQGAQARAAASGGWDAYGADFAIGRDAFIAEWGPRIDAYLAGSELAGYGNAFARAAFNYGVDPRWSPAISNTESGKGANCFAPCNAWGWHGGSWGSWEAAIDAHVAGLASVYGYTISYANAQKYCPPNYDNWYHNTLSEMAKI